MRDGAATIDGEAVIAEDQQQRSRREGLEVPEDGVADAHRDLSESGHHVRAGRARACGGVGEGAEHRGDDVELVQLA